MRNVLVLVGFIVMWSGVGITMEDAGTVSNHAYVIVGALLTSVLWAASN
jgi:hypothetical protein